MELEDCAFPAAGWHRSPQRPQGPPQGHRLRPAGGCPSNGMAWSALTRLAANARSSPPRQGTERRGFPQCEGAGGGQPCHTNAYIAEVGSLICQPRTSRGHAASDHNRAASQIAARSAALWRYQAWPWGNHSPTMYADYRFTPSTASPSRTPSTTTWNAEVFLPTVGKRGAAIIAAVACRRLFDPPTPPLTTCATGPWAPTASGSLWVFLPMAVIRHSQGSRVRLPLSPAKAANARSLKVCPSTHSAKKCINKTLARLEGEGRRQAPAVSYGSR